MNDYRHNRVEGGTFFFTVRLLEPGSTLLTDHFSAFGEAMRQARVKRPFHVDAWVVLPDHAHAIWTLPPGDHDCASRWRAVKIAFSKALRKSSAAGEQTIWAPHYQAHRVADGAEYGRLVDYVHMNPLRHGLCTQPADWQWSSLHRFVAAGTAAADASAPAQAKKKEPRRALLITADQDRQAVPFRGVIRMRISRRS